MAGTRLRWDQVLLVLVAYRLIAPGSEWRLHREWFERSALADPRVKPEDKPAGCGFRAGRDPQAVRLPRPFAEAQAGVVRPSGGPLARPVQCQLRGVAV